MPGIAGIIGEKTSKEQIALITETLKYEEFYRTETYIYENTAFGLSTFIPDNKIIFNRKTNIIGLMEGEIFGRGRATALTFLETLCENRKFATPDTWNKITGRFVFAFYDINTKKLFLITDHYGIKPLYFTVINNKFIFASSVGAILKCRDTACCVQRELNLQALAEYAIFNFPLGENTFIKNIHRIPPAEIWEIDSQFNISRKKYFDLSELITNPLVDAKQSLSFIPELFKITIENLSKNDKNLGLTLTGGYDTRTILSALSNVGAQYMEHPAMAVIEPREIHALTVGSEKDSQVIIASQLANVSKCLWIAQDYEDDFLQELERLILKTITISDGLCAITHTGWLYIFEKYRDYLDPCFSGLGGSELIRGLQSVDFPINQNIKKILLNVGAQYIEPLQNEDAYGFFSYETLSRDTARCVPTLCTHRRTSERATYFTLYEIFRKYYGAILALEESQARIRAPYMDHSLITFILQTPFSILHTPQFSNNLFERSKGQRLSASIIKQNNPKLLNISTDRGYSPAMNITPLGLPLILFYQLHNRLTPHYNQSSADNYLRNYAKIILEDSKTLNREYYNKSKIQKALENYPNWSLRVWEELAKVVTFELWLRKFIDTG